LSIRYICQVFHEEWLRPHDKMPSPLNIYFMIPSLKEMKPRPPQLTITKQSFHCYVHRSNA